MDERGELSMKWHKFLIYFALWAGAVVNVIQGANLLTGAQYGTNADWVYSNYSGLKGVDTAFGALLIAAGVFMIYTRFQLAGFKAGAPGKLTIAYILNLVCSAGYLVAASGAANLDLGNLVDSSTASSLAASVAMLFANMVYYKKRAHLFGDGAAAPATAGKPAAGFCPSCGGKIEPGDTFCVNCGAKLR